MGEFSDRRWNASVTTVLAGHYAVIGIKAQTLDFPNQRIWLTVHVNPPGGVEGGPAYGYGNLAISSPGVDGMAWLKPPVGTPLRIKAPTERVHPIPVARCSATSTASAGR